MKQLNLIKVFKILCTTLFFLTITVGCQNKSKSDLSNSPTRYGNFPLEQHWKKDFDSEILAMALSSTKIITGSFIDDRAIIQTFDTKTGSNIWKHELTGNSFGMSIMVIDETVYVVYSPKIIAMDLNTGKLVFENNINSSSLDEIAAYSDKHIIIVQVSNSVYAIDRLTGKQSWKILIGRGTPDVFSDTTREIVYLIHDEYIKAISEQDGNVNWQKLIDHQGAVKYDNEFIYFSTSSFPNDSENHLIALNLETRKILWDIRLRNRVKCMSATSDSIVAVTEKTLAKIDRLSGKKVWEYYISPNVYCPMAIQNNFIFLKVGSSNQIIALGLDEGNVLGSLDYINSKGIGYSIPKDNLLGLTYPNPILAYYLENSLYVYK